MVDPLADFGSKAIYEAFDSYQTQFRVITRKAQMRFENRDWNGMQADATDRLSLYKVEIDPAIAELRDHLQTKTYDKSLWKKMKSAYSAMIADRADWELAETFFNSVTRRIFATVGVDPEVEFVDSDFTPSMPEESFPYFGFETATSSVDRIERALHAFPFRVDFEDLHRDAVLASGEIQARFGGELLERIELIKSVFYRGKGAYLVGRVSAGKQTAPIAICLLHGPNGIVVDAVLLTEDEVSILFSFTRSYFHVQTDRAFDLVKYLKSILPRKPIAELYTAIGHNKHGKTELYRDLLRHLAMTHDKFEIAPGARGMVMTVFTLPSYEVVFKIIKDRFDHPKKTTRAEVIEKYRLVFTHDRAGRLVDAQEFEHLEFDRARFSEPLLQELQRVAAQTVTVNKENVVIKHLYSERRLNPLDLYLRSDHPDLANAAVMDYGNAIKDLARANVFPGDVLAKNFGVTRHGRIVFYDYDELCLLSECNFRQMPASSNPDEEFSGEPWYYIGEHDYFPEEFRRFMGLPDHWQSAFDAYHANLFDMSFWQSIQNRIRAGEFIHIFPYPKDKRFRKEIEG